MTSAILNSSNIYKIIKPNTIESGLKFSFSTGNWGVKSVGGKQGVAQLLNRLTYNSTLSYLRRVNTPLEKSGKLIPLVNYTLHNGELFVLLKLQKG